MTTGEENYSPVVIRNRNGPGGDLLEHVGRHRRDVDDGESIGGCLAQRDGTVLSTVHLLAILRLTDALDHLGHGQVESDVLVGSLGLCPHERTWSDEGQFDPVISTGTAGFVVTANLHLECDCLLGEMIYLLGLLSCVLAKAVRNS